MHILLTDDDTELTALLSEYLQANHIQCDIADNGRIALEKISQNTYDLMVLDIMMPEMDGLATLKQLNGQIPVIMLTAKDDDIDRIVGLELGADDYMGKPCNPRELLARIHAVAKRSHVAETAQDIGEEISHPLFTIDLLHRTCHAAGELLALTSTEFELLVLFLQHKSQVVDKAMISEQVLQRELQPFDRSVDVHVSRLRKKLSQYDSDAIKSIRGKGYQLTI